MSGGAPLPDGRFPPLGPVEMLPPEPGALTPRQRRAVEAHPPPTSRVPAASSEAGGPNPLSTVARFAVLAPEGWDRYRLDLATAERIRQEVVDALAPLRYSVWPDTDQPPTITRLPGGEEVEIARHLLAERDLELDPGATARRRRRRGILIGGLIAGAVAILLVVFLLLPPADLPVGYLAGLLFGLAIAQAFSGDRAEFWGESVVIDYSWRTAARPSARGSAPSDRPRGVPYAMRVWGGYASSANWQIRGQRGRSIRIGVDSPAGREARDSIRTRFGALAAS